MKKILIIIAFIIPMISFAQRAGEEYVETEMDDIASSEIEHGGYGAPVVKLSRLNKQDAVFSGLKGAWIMNHSFSLGGSAYTLVNNISVGPFRDYMSFTYGGLNIDYIYNPLDDFSISVGLMLGAGSYDFDDNAAGSDGVLLAEPEVSFMYSLNKNLKLALTAGYRAVTDVDLASVSNDKLSSGTYGVSLNWGEF